MLLAVARRTGLPSGVADYLTDEQFPDEIRRAAARQPSLPAETLDRLARTGSPNMQRAVARNPSMSPETLRRMAEGDFFVVSAAAQHPNMPADVLERLSRDEAEGLRRSVALNPAVPADILDRLVSDPEETVRVAARENPAAPDHIGAFGAMAEPDPD